MRHTHAQPAPRTLLGPSSVLQAEPWQHFQAGLSRRTHALDGTGWHALVIEERSRAGAVWYAPYGPVLAHPEVLPEALRELRTAAREHSVAWLRVEPQVPSPVGTPFAAAVQQQNATAPSLGAALRALGARPAPRDIQPAYTRWVDLALSLIHI